MYVLFVYIVDC